MAYFTNPITFISLFLFIFYLILLVLFQFTLFLIFLFFLILKYPEDQVNFRFYSCLCLKLFAFIEVKHLVFSYYLQYFLLKFPLISNFKEIIVILMIFLIFLVIFFVNKSPQYSNFVIEYFKYELLYYLNLNYQ